jgi:hypothetical protein
MIIKFETYSGWTPERQISVDTDKLPGDEGRKIERLAAGMKSESLVSGGMDMTEYDVEISTYEYGMSVKFHCDAFCVPPYAKELLDVLESKLPEISVPTFVNCTFPEIRSKP